jgi:hypothetical protein
VRVRPLTWPARQPVTSCVNFKIETGKRGSHTPGLLAISALHRRSSFQKERLGLWACTPCPGAHRSLAHRPGGAIVCFPCGSSWRPASHMAGWKRPAAGVDQALRRVGMQPISRISSRREQYMNLKFNSFRLGPVNIR